MFDKITTRITKDFFLIGEKKTDTSKMLLVSICGKINLLVLSISSLFYREKRGKQQTVNELLI